MLYAILCYDSEDVVGSWSKEKDAEVAEPARRRAAKARQARRRLGPVARLLPTTAATTVRKGREPLIIDGPFAETKGMLLGFYVVDCATLEEAIEVAKDLARAAGRAPTKAVRSRSSGRERRRVTEIAWIDAALTAARPEAIGALCAIFAISTRPEEAFQDACLRAQKLAAERPAAQSRRLAHPRRAQRRHRRRACGAAGRARCRRAIISDLDDAEGALAERLDGAHYRDDILRLLFICCHPDCRRHSRSRSRCASSPAFP